VVEETAMHWRYIGEFVDIERGYRLRREYRKRKSEKVGGRFSDERKETMAFEAGQSKCIRNVVINAMPGGLVQKVMETAKDAMRKDVAQSKGGIQKQIGKIEHAFKKYGVTIEQLESLLDTERKGWAEDEVVKLRELYQGLEDGMTRVEDVFPPESPVGSDEPSDGPPPADE
jgi:hypothetical protein